MRYYFAPMEGVTGYVFRSAHARVFGGADRYYAPFIPPDSQGAFKASELRDLLPENNRDLAVVPQLLCSSAPPFIVAARRIAQLGYKEINLNAGCPSGTVTAKGKGAGLLADPAKLAQLLDAVFEACAPFARVSVKTRMGYESTGELPALMEVYGRYPIAELIIHARDRRGMYKSAVDVAGYVAAQKRCALPLCYNGDVLSPGHLRRLESEGVRAGSVMAGRGAAANPALFRQLRGGAGASVEELGEFLGELERGYSKDGYSERIILGRLKELWYYMEHMFPGGGRAVKAIKKARSLADYRSAADILLTGGCYDETQYFRQTASEEARSTALSPCAAKAPYPLPPSSFSE